MICASFKIGAAVKFTKPPVCVRDGMLADGCWLQGLLAGRNDYELLRHGGIRDINRHSYR